MAVEATKSILYVKNCIIFVLHSSLFIRVDNDVISFGLNRLRTLGEVEATKSILYVKNCIIFVLHSSLFIRVDNDVIPFGLNRLRTLGEVFRVQYRPQEMLLLHSLRMLNKKRRSGYLLYILVFYYVLLVLRWFEIERFQVVPECVLDST
jgi:hypothetical protein